MSMPLVSYIGTNVLSCRLYLSVIIVGIYLIFGTMHNFSLLSLNVNGMRDVTKSSRIIRYCDLVNADIIFFQELFLSSTDDFRSLKDNWGGSGILLP